MTTAYSYVRFSNPSQARGDSLRRQTERAADYCRCHKLTLDTTLSLRDLGVSAFRGRHRDNPDTHALALFLKLVEEGHIPRGSYLIVEALDRLTREDIQPALMLILGLLQAGVRIAQLTPIEMVYTDKSGPQEVMLMIVELMRGHSESKSDRCQKAWAEKRKNAAAKVVTRKLPGWIAYDEDAGKLVLVRDRAATVRRVFAMARTMGMYRIAKALNAGGVPVIGRRTDAAGNPVRWSTITVANILGSPAAYGEYQPHKGRGKERRKDGPPVADYYPAAVDRDTFNAVRHATELRKTAGRGRRGKTEYLFSGLLRDWRDGGTMAYKAAERKWGTSLMPVGSRNGKDTPWSSFPAEPFERAIVSQLAEVKPADACGADGEAARRAEALAGEEAALARQIARVRDTLAGADDVASVVDALRAMEAKLRAAALARAEAEREAADPAAASWREFRTLAQVVGGDPSEEVRSKVRAAIRRAVARVDCLFFAPVGRERFAVVRVRFRPAGGRMEGPVRVYIIAYAPPHAGRGKVRTPGRWTAASFGGAESGLLDFSFDWWKPGTAKRTPKAKLPPAGEDNLFLDPEKYPEQRWVGEPARWTGKPPAEFIAALRRIATGDRGTRRCAKPKCKWAGRPDRDRLMPDRCPRCGAGGLEPVTEGEVTAGIIP
jgi:DNA invertase Pin-like site-specific DNA recombinase